MPILTKIYKIIYKNIELPIYSYIKYNSSKDCKSTTISKERKDFITIQESVHFKP